MTVALIDADSIMFRACFNVDNESAAIEKYDDLINTCMVETWADDRKIAIKGDGNFRYTVDPEYKSHRTSLPEPVTQYLPIIRDHALSEGAITADGMEADDLVCHWAYDMGFTDNVVCHLDKDLDMIPGEHFNFDKLTHYTVTAEDGMKWFYKQLLMGDKADGIKCLHGIGPVKANKIIEATDAETRLDTVKSMWARHHGKGWQEAMVIAGNLLWMRRFEGDTFKFEEGGKVYEPKA